MDDAATVQRIVEMLGQSAGKYPVARPHACAAGLVLPDGTGAPASVRAWASFDDHYPDSSARRRGAVAIAAADGVVVARSMNEIFRHVCVASIEAEIDGDDEARGYVEQLAADLAAETPGYGVLLDPDTQPDRVLWFGPDDEATVLWYEHDAVERRETFSAWAARLFT
jgi:hypothetical protein